MNKAKNKIRKIIDNWLKEETSGLNIKRSNKMILIFSYYDIKALEEIILQSFENEQSKKDKNANKKRNN